jgi:hypothetical protein
VKGNNDYVDLRKLKSMPHNFVVIEKTLPQKEKFNDVTDFSFIEFDEAEFTQKTEVYLEKLESVSVESSKVILIYTGTKGKREWIVSDAAI